MGPRPYQCMTQRHQMHASTNKPFAKAVRFATKDRTRYRIAKIVKPGHYPGHMKQQHQYRRLGGAYPDHCLIQS